jgi:membrane protein implicated in regulation of membrane protease activity
VKEGEGQMKSRTKLYIALPAIAVLVIVLVYFQLFTNPLVDLGIVALYVVVSLWNRRKFNKEKEQAEKAKPRAKKPS